MTLSVWLKVGTHHYKVFPIFGFVFVNSFNSHQHLYTPKLRWWPWAQSQLIWSSRTSCDYSFWVGSPEINAPWARYWGTFLWTPLHLIWTGLDFDPSPWDSPSPGYWALQALSHWRCTAFDGICLAAFLEYSLDSTVFIMWHTLATTALPLCFANSANILSCYSPVLRLHL